jgi:hypothetical protein
MTTKPAFQKILRGILQTEDENKHSHGRMGIIKSQEKSRQVITEKHRIAHTQTLTQQKQLNDRNHYIPLNINTEH